ncbi:MAG: M67 family metallopeptidase [Candidatus Bathyarchaeia archaeon]|nr:M67 family metallopeptidase [Candidatus Bathyarchaeota archaeon]
MSKDEGLIIRLSKREVDWLIKAAQKSYPLEICGALFGLINSDGRILIKKVVILSNILNSSVAFQIDPEEFLAELMRSENEGLRHVGFFHSHPGSATPSDIDVKFMRLWPESIWLIISLINYEIAAYRIVNSEVRNVHVEII